MRVNLRVVLVCVILVSAILAGSALLSARRKPSRSQSGQEDIRKIAAQLIGQGPVSGTVCDVAVLPASGERPETLVASYDVSGRLFCNWIAWIRTGPQPAILQDIQTYHLDSVAAVVRDLDGDGNPELIVPQQLAHRGDEASGCVAVVPAIYHCSADLCSDVSERFLQFYAADLDARERQLAMMENRRSERDVADLMCRTIERDKLKRVLGMDRRAGMASAVEWMKSADPELRQQAIRVFTDIDDPAAKQALQDLTHDRDPGVADLARGGLARKK